MKEAYLYKKLKDNTVRCDLCNHRCVIADGEKGKCAVRKNHKGTLTSLVYDKVISLNIDPIEKKPLFHFLPGTKSLSLATPGCNFKCFFCQNWQISQMPCDYEIIDGRKIPPETIVSEAIAGGCKSISYTYTEPTVYFELAYDTAKLAHGKNIKNVFVTNGFMTGDCIEMIGPYLDAANIDLKIFSVDFYREKIGGRIKPVMDNIKHMHKLGVWIEITTLLIPGLNDSDKELEGIAGFLSGISNAIPWHISAYYPNYKSVIEPTGINSIVRACSIGKNAGLKYVYGGNTGSNCLENTICPECGKTVLQRSSFYVSGSKIINGRCGYCSKEIDGVFE